MAPPHESQSYDPEIEAQWPLFRRVPRESDKVMALSTKNADNLLALINSADAQKIRDEAERVFRVSVDHLLLSHEGDGIVPGLKTRLREHIEREISARTLTNFTFDTDKHFKRFAIDSCILWRFYGFTPQLERWYADHWARGFIVRKELDYLRHIALAHRRMVEQSVQNFHFMKALFPKLERRYFKGDWKKEMLAWLSAVNLKPEVARRSIEDAERLLQIWENTASEENRSGWRPFFVRLDDTNTEHNRPTSLITPRKLHGSDYIEVWRYWDAPSRSWVDTGYWIEVTKGKGARETDEEWNLMTRALEALGDSRPRYVGLSSRRHVSVTASDSGRPAGFVEKRDGEPLTVHLQLPGDGEDLKAKMNEHSRCLGPWLDAKDAHEAAKLLRSEGLASGNIIEVRLHRTFRRPAAPAQWKRPR